jgi:hypothetical protein
MIISDSYMGMFLPENIPARILQFIDKKIEFPFLDPRELMACFYLFGKRHGVHGNIEVMTVKDLAQKTISQVSSNVRRFANQEITMNKELIRQNFIKRSTQIAIDSKDLISSGAVKIDRRISRDPTIMSDTFALHVAHYKKNYFFYLFDPLPSASLPSDVRPLLADRMLMLCYSVKEVSQVPFDSILSPFLEWIRISSNL